MGRKARDKRAHKLRETVKQRQRDTLRISVAGLSLLERLLHRPCSPDRQQKANGAVIETHNSECL